MSGAHLSIVDHDARLVSPVRIGTSSKSLRSAKLLLEDMLPRMKRVKVRYVK